jgi:hypothetical protein
VVESNQEHSLYIFNELQPLFCNTSMDDKRLWLDPLSYFCHMMREKKVECRDFTEAFSKISIKVCRNCYRRSDLDGFMKAFNSIADSNERVLLLMSLEEDASNVIKDLPWSDHPAFLTANLSISTQAKPTVEKPKIDLTEFVIDELSKIGDFKQAGEFLEKRGEFLLAASNFNKVSDGDKAFALVKSFICRVRHVELTLKSCNTSQLQNKVFLKTLKEYLEIPPELSRDLIPMETKASFILSHDRLDKSRSEKLWITLFETVNGSVLWHLEGLKSLLLTYQYDGLMNRSSNLGDSFLQRSLTFFAIVSGVFPYVDALLQPAEYRGDQQWSLVAQVERFFEVHVDSVSLPQVSTNNIWNLRLRESLLYERIDLSTLTILGTTSSFVLTLNRSRLHPVFAQYLSHTALLLLCEFDKWLASRSLNSFADTIQARIICLDNIQKLCRLQRIVQLKPWWLDEFTKYANKAMQESVAVAFRFIKSPQLFVDRDRSCLDIQWLSDFVSTLKRELLKENRNTLRDQRRENINVLIILWRLENFSDSHTFAIKAIEHYISEVEQPEIFAGDISKNKTHHILPQKGKLIAKDAMSISRLLCWAVDFIYRDQPDLLMSMKLMCHLQWKINASKSLKSIDVDFQLTFIETNITGLLSCLSCYYSIVNNGDRLWCMIPERSYLDSFLCGRNNFYGRPLCEIIPGTVAAHSSEIVDIVEGFLQALSSLILDLGILSRKEFSQNKNVGEQMERVVCLTLIISINAITFHKRGHPPEAPPLNLPFRQLSGSVLKLMKEFFQALVQKRVFPHHLQSPISPETVTVEELPRIFQRVLDSTRNDNLIYFCLDEKAAIMKHPVEASLIYEPMSFKRILDKCDDDELYVSALTTSKKLSVSFANDACLEGISAVKVFGLSQKIPRDYGVLLTLDELEYLGIEVRQNRAASSIQRCWHFHRGKKLKPGMFFRRITAALTKFQRKIKRSSSVTIYYDQADLYTEPLTNSLATSENLWNEERLKVAYRCWNQVVNSNNAFFDGIECTYCSMATTKDDVKKQQARLNWCEIHCENESYYKSAKKYNFKHFGAPFAPFTHESVKKDHERSDLHKKNVEEYNKKSDAQKSEMCKSLALLECSTLIMQKIISQQQKQEEESNSWYISVHDEAYALQVKLESLFHILRRAALFWPYPKNTGALLKKASKLCTDAQTFFHEKIKGRGGSACEMKNTRNLGG